MRVNSVAATTSWTKGSPYRSDTPRPTEPVRANENWSASLSVSESSERKASMAAGTLAWWRLYDEYMTSALSFNTTILAVVEPTSSPILYIYRDEWFLVNETIAAASTRAKEVYVCDGP